MSTSAGRAASALKSGVVYSGSAIVNGINTITPHLAGAVDIVVVRQADGQLKSSPFYVRFGKYTSLRTRDRSVQVIVNGEDTGIQMHLGSYGQAYFVAEYTELYSGSEEEVALSGMISPPSGYSSGEVDAPYANADLVASVRMQVGQLRQEAELQKDDLITARLDNGEVGDEEAIENSKDFEEPDQQLPNDVKVELLRSATVSVHVDEDDAIPAAAQQPTTEAPNSASPCTSEDQNNQDIADTSASHPMSTENQIDQADQVDQQIDGDHTELQETVIDVSEEDIGEEGMGPTVDPICPAGVSPFADTAISAPKDLGQPCEEQINGHCSIEDRQDSDPAVLDDSMRCTGKRFDLEMESERGFSAKRREHSFMDLVTGEGTNSRENLELPISTSGSGVDFPQLPERGSVEADWDNARKESTGLTSEKIEEEPCMPSEMGVEQSDQGVKLVIDTASPDACVVNISERRSASCQGEQTMEGITDIGVRSQSEPVEAFYSIDSEYGRPEATSARKLKVNLLPELSVDSLDASPYDGYLGDSDQPTTGFMSPVSERESMPGGVEGLKGFQLSLCGHLLRRNMTPSEAQTVFEANMIRKEEFGVCGISLTQSPDLVCRIGGIIYPWSAAAPMVLGMLAFGGRWDNLIQQGAMYNASAGDASENKGSPTTRKVSSSWRLWPFGSWRGRRSSKSGDMSPIEPQSPQSQKDDTEVQEGTPSPTSRLSSSKFKHSSNRPRRKKHRVVTKKTLSATAEQLSAMKLKDGQNIIEFQIGNNTKLQAYMYVISWKSKVVISDIDGTVTKSDLLGHLLPPIGVDWTHSGVAHLFSNIKSNGYEILFLSSRAIAQANITRDFLHSLEQGEHKMPVGPVIISPHGLLPSLYREMILRRPHDFKIGCLQDIRVLFPDDWNPFYAGFGNRNTDVLSYEKVGVPPSRIFTINSNSQIVRGSLTSVQSSTWSSLQSINELVDKVFPGVSGGDAYPQREEFNDFYHWRLPMSYPCIDDPELQDVASIGKSENDLQSPGQLAESILKE